MQLVYNILRILRDWLEPFPMKQALIVPMMASEINFLIGISLRIRLEFVLVIQILDVHPRLSAAVRVIKLVRE
jgi:hypothetical protein